MSWFELQMKILTARKCKRSYFRDGQLQEQVTKHDHATWASDSRWCHHERQAAVVPRALRSEYLEQQHPGHNGAKDTECRAWEAVYWSTMYADIEEYVVQCAKQTNIINPKMK